MHGRGLIFDAVTMTLVIAHRGASRAERENTIAAFRRAVEMGADGIELDVRRSADDRLVVHHDAALADGRLIRHTGSADLPDHIPSLAAALDACEGAFVNVEIKNDPSDPDFDPSRRAAYYVRVLEIPTPRWSTYDSVRNNLPLTDIVPATIQERAWSSPIWYTPASQ